MTRRLLNVLTALSLLLCLAAAGLWVRSCWRHDQLQFRPRAGGGLVIHLFWSRGSVVCSRTYGQVNGVMPAERRVRFRAGTGRFPPSDLYASWKTRAPVFHGGGFAVSHAAPQYGALGGVLAPLWFPTALFGLPPLAWLAVRVRRAWRRPAGLCVSCGYDLRATPDRCPECGELSSALTR